MSIESPRRFFLLKRLASRLTNNGLEEVWHSKQIEMPGTALGTGFPYYDRLVAAGYLAVEDLDGATEDELQQSGFSRHEAIKVLAAL